MGPMASPITNLTLVYSTVYKRKHQSSASLAFVREIHRWPVNSPHKGPVTQKMFPFHDVIMILLVSDDAGGLFVTSMTAVAASPAGRVWLNGSSTFSTAVYAPAILAEAHLGSDIPYKYERWKSVVECYVIPIICAIGIPCNGLSFLIWIHPHMRNSTGVYLAYLALSEIVVLMVHLLSSLHSSGRMPSLRNHGVCITSSLFHVASECLALLTVLALTIDWYIIVCHPMKRQKLCTVPRALRVLAVITVISLGLGGCEAMFWSYNADKEICDIRPRIRAASGYIILMEMGNMAILFIGVLLPAFVVILLNFVIVRRLKRSQESRTQIVASSRNSSPVESTMMLLYVSSCLVLAEILDLFDYLMTPFFRGGDPRIPLELRGKDPLWLRHYRYFSAALVLDCVALVTYMINILIYSFTGRKFRRTLCIILCRLFKLDYHQRFSRTSHVHSHYLSESLDMRHNLLSESARLRRRRLNAQNSYNQVVGRNKMICIEEPLTRAISVDYVDKLAGPIVLDISSQERENSPLSPVIPSRLRRRSRSIEVCTRVTENIQLYEGIDRTRVKTEVLNGRLSAEVWFNPCIIYIISKTSVARRGSGVSSTGSTARPTLEAARPHSVPSVHVSSTSNLRQFHDPENPAATRRRPV